MKISLQRSGRQEIEQQKVQPPEAGEPRGQPEVTLPLKSFAARKEIIFTAGQAQKEEERQNNSFFSPPHLSPAAAPRIGAQPAGGPIF